MVFVSCESEEGGLLDRRARRQQFGSKYRMSAGTKDGQIWTGTNSLFDENGSLFGSDGSLFLGTGNFVISC